MQKNKITILLVAVVLMTALITACTSSEPASPAPVSATTVVSPESTHAAAAPSPQATPECPDTYGKGVWDFSWDTRWMGYAGNHDIRDISFTDDGTPDSWNGINAPSPTTVKMTQKCRDVSGTIIFAMDPPCSATITGTIDKNQLSGTWKTNGCEPEEGSNDGKFYLTMAPDNLTWTGKLIGSKWLTWCPDCPPNWAGKRL